MRKEGRVRQKSKVSGRNKRDNETEKHKEKRDWDEEENREPRMKSWQRETRKREMSKRWGERKSDRDRGERWDTEVKDSWTEKGKSQPILLCLPSQTSISSGKKKKNQKQTKKIMETPNRTDIHFAVVEMSDTGLRFQWMHGEMMEVNTCTETGGTSLVAFCLFLHPSSSWLENYPHSKEEEIESKEFWTRERKLASSMPFLLPLRPKGHPSRSTRTLPSFPCSEYSPPREIGLSFKSQPTLLVQGQSLVHLSRGHIAQDLLHKSHQ